ncbi:MAG TPA: zinc ribbon domain-containing protein [Bacteroidetes bacterium]|nr:zinc ribbon domain-containing protein [Bacteroidota bacterium]
MPIYDFICRKCGEKFDRLVSFDWESAGLACPKCGSEELEKAVSRVGYSGGDKFATSAASSCPTCSTGTCSTCS